MRILIVEDEEHLANGLRFNLEAEGFDVVIAPDGEAALSVLKKQPGFDAVVLDVMLPDLDGFEVVQDMRSKGDYTPVLMLTALGRPEDVLKGFASGTDDYLAKPFDLDIFLARLKGLLRRSQWVKSEVESPPAAPDAIRINGRLIDLANLRIETSDEVVPLTLMEAKLLRYLIENDQRPVSRSEILKKVWGLAEDTDTRAIDNFIVRLRRYLGDPSDEAKIVETVRGVGYRFVNPHSARS